MEELHDQRDELAHDSIMEAADYVSQHVTVNGQTLCELYDDIAAQMAAQYPEELAIEDYNTVSLFGLNRIKVDDTVVSEIPGISFNFNEDYVMEWVAEIEDQSAEIQNDAYENMMQLSEELEASFMDAAERDQDIGARGY